MRIEELIPHLVKFDKIIVTGPQRSGTTIATKIIAEELGYIPIDEGKFGVDKLVKFGRFLNEPDGLVIQAPALSSIVHLINTHAVVFMWRDVADIIKSGDRIDWNNLFDDSEKAKYFHQGFPKHSAYVKQNVWNNYQKPLLGDRAFDLEYESLASSRLWVPKERRVNFHAKQTHETL